MNPPIDRRHVRRLALASALATAHSKGIIHRDLFTLKSPSLTRPSHAFGNRLETPLRCGHIVAGAGVGSGGRA